MKKLPLSSFDLVMIVVFVVVTLLGGGAWWYLSGLLVTAQQDVGSAKSDFDKYSKNQVYLPTTKNVQTLQGNIDLIKAQIDPLVQTKFHPPENKLSSIGKMGTVEWKHDLDDRVSRLNAAAKVHGVVVPPNFYYSFSRYLNQNPGDEKTIVLSKQILAIEQIATIFINAPVKGIQSIRRSYEEDPPSSSGGGPGGASEPDHLASYSTEAPGGIYTAYPFEVEFEATTEGFRKVIDDLIQSPYLFVVRSVAVQNTRLDSPQIGDLEKMAGTPAPSVTDSSPGEVAANRSTKGPQYLFGNETLRIKARIDLIEWKGDAAEASSDQPASHKKPSSPGGNG